MPIKHTNRQGKTYWLHEGKTKTGKPKWFFSMKTDGQLADTIPEGFETYENANCQVLLRKIVPKLISDQEVAVVEEGIRQLAKLDQFVVDVRGKELVVHISDRNERDLDRMADIFGKFGSFTPRHMLAEVLQESAHYTAMMRFTLVDDEKRQFSVCRWCFKGSIDDWFPLGGGELSTMVKKYVPHLGKESFFELM